MRRPSKLFFSLLLLTLALSACGEDRVAGPGPDPEPEPEPEAPTTATLSGRIVNGATREPISGASISFGDAATTSDPDGYFQLIDLPVGAGVLRSAATGFEDLEQGVTLPSGLLSVAMYRKALHEFGDFALYAPPSVRSVRGVLVALGGPDTRAFASGGTFGAPAPEVETALSVLGERFRALAASRGLAILGTSLSAMGNDVTSDELLAAALAEAATISARPEIAAAPLLVYGMSGGAAQASGFLARHPERTIGLFLKVPSDIEPPVEAAALSVPAFVVLAEEDAFVDNEGISSRSAEIRQAGGLWALAVERAVPHHSLTPRQRELTLRWMSDLLDIRFPAGGAGPMTAVVESEGWLGDPVSIEVNPWDYFTGARDVANWLPSDETAFRWGAFGIATGPDASTLRMIPRELTVRREWLGYLFVDVRNETGARVENPLVIWVSDREDVATVAMDQLCAPGCRDWAYIGGHAEGTATISARYGAVEPVTAAVTVLPAVSLEVTPLEATIPVGGTVDVTVRVIDEHGTVVTTPEFDVYYYRCPDCWGVPSPISVDDGTLTGDGTHFRVTGTSPGTDAVFFGPNNAPAGMEPVAVITVE